MEYDVTRARILLRDLERMNQGLAPAVELGSSPDGGLPLRGTGTRAGVMRMGIRLAQAALAAESHVEVYPNGQAGADGSMTDAMMQLHLVEDRPDPTLPKPWWVDWIFNLYWLAVWILCVIGIVTVVRWIIAGVGS